ncbi:MAG: hypothetical protein ABWX92_04400 [Mycetocola sp.]
MTTHSTFHGESQVSAKAASEAIDAYYNRSDQPRAFNDAIAEDDSYSALRWIVARAINNSQETTTVASLDGTVDEADWLSEGHVLDAYEVAYLRSLIVPKPSTE